MPFNAMIIRFNLWQQIIVTSKQRYFEEFYGKFATTRL